MTSAVTAGPRAVMRYCASAVKQEPAWVGWEAAAPAAGRTEAIDVLVVLGYLGGEVQA